MLLSEDFSKEMDRLHLAFDKTTTNAPSRDRRLAKYAVWFAMYKQRYPQASAKELRLLVDEAVAGCERLPNFKQLIDCHQLVSANREQMGTTLRVHCNECEGTGGLDAMLNPRNDGDQWDRRSTFRCDACRNWEGRYSANQPAWHRKWIASGWILTRDLPMTPRTLERRRKGVQLLKESAPKLFARLKEDRPDLAALIEQPQIARQAGEAIMPDCPY